jgi:hypothetical protein
VNLMADSIPGAGEDNSITGSNRLKVTMVVRILKSRLEHIVIDVGDRELCLYTVKSKGFKLKVGHGSGGILCQGLIDTDCDFLSGNHFSGNQVIFKDFLCQVKRHCLISLGEWV